jgi:hypothetical protein
MLCPTIVDYSQEAAPVPCTSTGAALFLSAMPLSLRRTRLSSPVYADKADYCVIDDGKVIGRIYEEWYTPPDLRWFWSITDFHIDPALGITTNGRVPTLDEAKAQFKSSWERVRAASQSWPWTKLILDEEK